MLNAKFRHILSYRPNQSCHLMLHLTVWIACLLVSMLTFTHNVNGEDCSEDIPPFFLPLLNCKTDGMKFFLIRNNFFSITHLIQFFVTYYMIFYTTYIFDTL